MRNFVQFFKSCAPFFIMELRRIKSSQLTETNVAEYVPRGELNLREIQETVQSIIDDIKTRGDAAIYDYTEKFERLGPDVTIRSLPIRVTPEEIQEAREKLTPKLLSALKGAKANIERFHKAQLPKDWRKEFAPGLQAGQIYRPIEKVGVYAPGGEGVYPSTVLMTVLPALVAGVPEIAIASPPQRDGKVSPAILGAADLCGIDRIYRMGGVQAIAAFAHGTESVDPVYKIMGPGNKWVNAAKQLVSSKCAIDTPAGPSEILLLVDESANVEDLLIDFTAQVEHGPDNVGVLVSHDSALLDAFQEKFPDYLKQCERKAIIEDSLEKGGLIVETEDLADSIRVANIIASEHLHIQVANPEEVIDKINNAGAIFIGKTTPVALGDYCGGTNHVLPTGGYALMHSGLSTMTYLKIIDVLHTQPEALKELEEILAPIAEYEGFLEHRNSVTKRSKK